MSAGEMAASMAVFEFPPRFSLSSQVRTESLNGMWSPFFFFPLAFPPANSAKAEMTFENVSSKAVNVALKIKSFFCLWALLCLEWLETC